jgi:hypothetical protein
MASKKANTNESTEVKGVPAVPAGAEVPETGTKLRWTSLKAAEGGARRTKQPKAKKSGTIKSAKTQKHAAQSKKLSALDAAAKVLQEAGQPMNCPQLIQAMADKDYWTSPAGKTPAATLYSALTRETKTKGSQARFHKTARGHFVYQTPQAS